MERSKVYDGFLVKRVPTVIRKILGQQMISLHQETIMVSLEKPLQVQIVETTYMVLFLKKAMLIKGSL